MEFIEDGPDFLLVGGKKGGVTQFHIMAGIVKLAHGLQFKIFPGLGNNS